MGARSALLATSIVLFTTDAAWAQESSGQDTINEEAARELAGACSKSLDSADFKAAYDQCSRAEKLYPSREKPPALLIFLARACRGVGKFVCARDAYTRVATTELRTGLSPDAQKTQEAFIEEGRRERLVVAEMLGRITLVVKGAIPGIKVMLDDTSIDSAAFGVKLPIDPGAHVVTAEAPGFNPYAYRFTIAERQDANAPVNLTPVTKPGWSTGRHVATWSSFGVGAAGLAVGTYFAVRWASLNSTLSAKCSGRTALGEPLCPPGSDTEISTLRSRSLGAGIAFGAAGAGIVVGTILVLTAPKYEAPKAGLTVRPEVGIGSVGVSGSF
jgi:hypothetical protein